MLELSWVKIKMLKQLNVICITCTSLMQLPVPLQVSWTQALRTIVKNCYKQHGREDLLYAFEDQQVPTTATTQHHLTTAQSIAHLVPSQTVVQTINNPDGTVSLIQVPFSRCTVVRTVSLQRFV